MKIHPMELTHEGLDITLLVLSDAEEDEVLDILVIDGEGAMMGHLSTEMFTILAEENILSNRDSIVAALTVCTPENACNCNYTEED